MRWAQVVVQGIVQVSGRAVVRAAAGLLLCGGFALASEPATIGTPVAVADDDAATREQELLERIAKLESMVLEMQKEMGTLEMNGVLARLHVLEADAAGGLDVLWKDGLRIENPDGSVKLRIGGRVITDFQNSSGDGDLSSVLGDAVDDDAAEIRTARLYMSGEIDQVWEYKAEFDFVDTDADVKDAYVGLLRSPVGRVRVGHIREPFSLEDQTSSKYVSFMERALPNALAPGRNIGVLVNDHTESEALNWAAGLFKTTDDGGDDEGQDGEWGLTGRLTGTPLYREHDDGPEFVHLGAALSRRSDEWTSVSVRPEVHTGPRFIETGTIDGVDQIELLGLEAAYQCGPFSISGERIEMDVERGSGMEDLSFDGHYVQASWFLTDGDHRGYKRDVGTFDRVKPQRPFGMGEGEGCGAWELAARVSSIDVDDGEFTLAAGTGGMVDSTSFGLNWYMNNNVRVLWNYIDAELDDVDDADYLTMRVQVEF